MKRTTTTTVTVLAAAGLFLAGCSNEDSPTNHGGMNHGSGSAAASSMPHMGHSNDGGAAPAGMNNAAHPRYPVGSTVTVTADHMPGMKNAKATVVGAYQTFTYAVTYTPTNGGNPIPDHKWVVQQEIKDAGTQRLADGTKVTLTADHMPGMKDATGTVDSSTDQTVYMVDYDMNGMTMKNHKWVVESELRPAS